MRVKAAAWAAIALAVIGFAVSVDIALVHRALTAGFTSWCDVNESVSCSTVLGSEWARLAGVPVAWWAALTYALSGGLAGAVLASARATPRRRAATLLFALAAWSLLFSVYMAVIALVVIRAVCVLCVSLYVVNTGLCAAAGVLWVALRSEGRGGERLWKRWQERGRLIGGIAVVAVAALIGFVVWEAMGGGGSALTAEELAAQDPEFHRWWQALAVVRPEELPPVAAVDPGRAAPVTIVEFSDFECPMCAKAFRNLKRVLPRLGDQVRVELHHFPLDKACNPSMSADKHRFACLAAVAAECAAAQGIRGAYEDRLFENQSMLDRDSLIRHAERVGVDRGRFLACLDSEEPRKKVERDVEFGRRLRLERTPTLFIDGRRVEGALESEKFYAAIRFAQAARAANR